MKLVRIVHHQRNTFPEDLLLNAREHSNIKKGDIVEIYHPDEKDQKRCRLLLQVSFAKDTQRDYVSVESSIALTFNLKNYGDVCMTVVDPQKVALDSVEFTFKDQYLGRSEMWRLKKFLKDTCVYINKKINYCDTIRCQVYEMWSMGERVACGVIDENTKIVYRSSTSMVYLFLQMSSEMWDFDIHGDLYFEKAVNGFLTELFAKWKKQSSNHEVTIVLFSRTFYEAKSLDEFPADMRECLQMDFRGRFYEDFYRIAVQNERNDDWSSILVELRRLFTAYKDLVLKYHEKPYKKIPKAYNSSAAQGNFLEVLNISLNVFEKHYLDRSFDRTGQMSVVITPGVGVFEVDRELTNLTKQRIIDNGVSSDLVCVGEQPLHAVPLLKFHYKDISLQSIDDYCFPHWINLSFYSSNKKVAYSTFIPRIKLPPFIEKPKTDKELSQSKLKKEISYYDDSNTEYIHNSLFDYDAYDEKVFGFDGSSKFRRTKKSSVPSLDLKVESNYSKPTHRRKMSDPDVHHIRVNSCSENLEHSFHSSFTSFKTKMQADTVERALINPFDPSHVTVKLTSNRRRWSHIFPKTKTGNLIQQHHYQTAINQNANFSTSHHDEISHSEDLENQTLQDFESRNCRTNVMDKFDIISSTPNEKGSYMKTHCLRPKKLEKTFNTTPSKSLLWGATGEQEWTAQTKTGVDWKSLTIPACLPITTDYFPDKRSLNNDYFFSIYTLLPDDVNEEFMIHRAVQRKPLNNLQVFYELVSQRLAQGFQLIIISDENQGMNGNVSIHNKSLLSASIEDSPKVKLLSIGRIFHKITLNDSEIKVTIYRPRHPYSPINVEYRYRFHAPQHDNYEVSGVIFSTEKLENFNWNLMDQYICTRGDTDFMLHEQMKYWRYRMYLLPKDDKYTKKIIDENLEHCDIYCQEDSPQFFKNQVDDFIKFVETHLNKVKRMRKTRGSPIIQSSHLTKRRHSTSTSIHSKSQNLKSQNTQSSPYRERVGSNIYPERLRPSSNVHVQNRSGSKIETKSQLMALQASQASKFESEDNDDCFAAEPTKLPASATIEEIFEAFKNPSTGVEFLESLPSLPSMAFSSYDAFVWLSNRVELSSNPWTILSEMKSKKLICHASGDATFPVKPGFYLYYIVNQDITAPEFKKPLGDFEAFEYEWLETEIPEKFIIFNASMHNSQESLENESKVPMFLRDEIERRNIDGVLYKQAHLEVDVTSKSDRVEWGHARYNREMIPGTAFEITVQWVTASGPIVQELVKQWSRKAEQCNFQLISIPSDPLAEPFIDKSDPLRSPIFIPLNVKCLMQNKSHIFEDFPKETWDERMIWFQDFILKRFGFIPRLCETKTGSNDICADWHYVHITGNMFVLVPATPHAMRVALRRFGKVNQSTSLNESISTQKKLKNYYHSDNTPTNDSHQYISMHVLGKNSNSKESLDRPSSYLNNENGFLWQWNHAIPNRKWKSCTINGSDELFQYKMLRNFREFCANDDNRLVRCFEDAWEKKEMQSLANNK